MTIKLASKKDKKPLDNRFKKEDIDLLFSQSKDWNDFYTKNKKKFAVDKLDIYEWCVFPLLKKEEPFYRCEIHDIVNIDAGDKKYTFPFKNIHFSEFVSHCIFYKPEEHKAYIMDKLFH